MFSEAMNFSVIRFGLDAVFSNSFEFTGKYKRPDPYAVSVSWVDDETIKISARGYYKLIKAKNNIIDTLFGSSWEGRVQEAKQKAFETAYISVREEEKRTYQLSKL